MVYFDGFDVTKEIQYGYAVPDLAARGVGCLIVDGPGNGESVRFRNLPLIAETERYATPVYEYLAGRPEFDPKRIGVMALSLGGYYAPRAASLEPRYACCIAWGAQWDYHAIWKKRLEDLATGKVLSLSVPPEHLQWVLGVDSQAAALKVLEGFRLDGIVQKMNCPFLLLHGEGDEQISLSLAHTLFDAVGSKAEDAQGLHPRGGRLPPLPGRQHHHRRPRHVGLGVRRAQARALIRMKSEQRDGMQIDWDAPIEMDDGVVLRADVFRPIGGGKHPVILSYGPYAKGLAFQEGYKGNWDRLIKAAPEVLEGSTNKYQVWELVDPEKWVPDGYACVRVDSRGAGRSPGYHRHLVAARGAGHLPLHRMGRHAAVEQRQGRHERHLLLRHQPVAGRQRSGRRISPRSASGKASPTTIASSRATAASSRGFTDSWYKRQVLRVQHGVGENGPRSAVTGEPVAGPETLPPDELAKNAADAGGEVARRHLVDDFYRARMVAFEQDRGAAAFRRQLGRRGPAPARQFRRLSARGLAAEVARGARRHALHTFLQQLRHGACRSASSVIS